MLEIDDPDRGSCWQFSADQIMLAPYLLDPPVPVSDGGKLVRKLTQLSINTSFAVTARLGDHSPSRRGDVTALLARCMQLNELRESITAEPGEGQRRYP